MSVLSRKSRGSAGFSLVELIIAMSMIVIALLALMSSVFSSSRLVDASRERSIAYGAARAKIEEMRTFSKCSTFGNIFNHYKLTLNRTDTVTGLNPVMVGGVAQPIVTVYFPTDGKVDTACNLMEENPSAPPEVPTLAAILGLPKDLNRSPDGSTLDVGTGTGNAVDLNVTYKILPTLVRVQWRSAGGGGTAQSVELTAFIAEK